MTRDRFDELVFTDLPDIAGLLIVVLAVLPFAVLTAPIWLPPLGLSLLARWLLTRGAEGA